MFYIMKIKGRKKNNKKSDIIYKIDIKNSFN